MKRLILSVITTVLFVMSISSCSSSREFKGFDLKPGADLGGANLSGADLSNADLAGAFLDGANMSGADLTNTNLEGAFLDGTNLTDAILSNTNLKGARLSPSTILDNAEWKNVICPAGTRQSAPCNLPITSTTSSTTPNSAGNMSATCQSIRLLFNQASQTNSENAYLESLTEAMSILNQVGWGSTVVWMRDFVSKGMYQAALGGLTNYLKAYNCA